ncbi:MAG: type II toxin-antitoxin system mRNA interferase toxin, RelE/StbE family [bacterium]|nr:type II toxin-antitoxin system mRNA interferase toxin, RelE/StbE family [bacterium]
MFEDEYHPQVKKDLKGIDKPVILDIKEKHILLILEAPFEGEELSGDLSGIFSYHFRKNKIDYRISYIINEKKKVVYILMIGKRENFYKLLKKRLP